ncbi:ABC transporter permease [Olivibacter ginsenosidimutans]|uniref:ABC transporter permease n=2 Tax=Olivibacter ginsenosidimutans TaxID=1176537 RepID=A0ABP9C120_9SPHI
MGLAVGISAALVITMLVSYEFGFDRFQAHPERIFRVVTDIQMGSVQGHNATVPGALSQAAQELTGIDRIVPMLRMDMGTMSVQIDQANGAIKTLSADQVIFTDANYFQLIPYKWLFGGNISQVLKNPFQVVLSQRSAEKYFPRQPLSSVVGQHITYNGLMLTVSGVVADLTDPSDLEAKEFISLQTLNKLGAADQATLNSWDDWSLSLYLQLAPGTAPQQIEHLLNNIFTEHQSSNDPRKISLHLQPLHEVHFDSRYETPGIHIADKSSLYALLAIASFLLLLGSLNYINLTTAQASKRAKEVGIRKTNGSSRQQLIIQFLGETFIVTLLATIFSLLLCPFLLKLFSSFLPPGLTLDFLWKGQTIGYLSLLVISVTFFAGCYPAIVLSGFNPVHALKDQSRLLLGQSRQLVLRKGLTIAQFTIAQFFIILTLIISKQVYYVLHTNMGFQQEAIISFSIPNKSHRAALKQSIRALPGVAKVSTGFVAPAYIGAAFSDIIFNNGKEALKFTPQVRTGDEDYFDVYQLQLIAGRKASASDSVRELMINKAFMHELGYKNPTDVLGKLVHYGRDKSLVPIVGIMQDFHTQNLHAPISPLIFGVEPGQTFHVRLAEQTNAAEDWQQTISAIRKSFKKIYPEASFDYTFVNQQIAKFYEKERATTQLLNWATGLSIFISCLGLLGLVIFTTNSRTKELGIRKILGASISNLVLLLSKDFIRLIIIAFSIAAPIGWWAGHEWLKDFAYKTSINWWLFLIGIIGMVGVALAVLAIQTFKAARANPVDSLRDE